MAMSPRDPLPAPAASPNPDRDRRLAHRPRLGYRRADEVAEVMEGFLGSEAARRVFKRGAVFRRDAEPFGSQ